jgi:hypothetical protein
LHLPSITAPGCMLSTTTGATLWEPFMVTGGFYLGLNGFFVPPGFSGVELHAQAIVLGGLSGGPDLISVASNALKHTVGLQ